jgi:hypothetical protein
LKRKIAVFDPDEGFFALHSSGYGGIKRQDRTLRKQPVAVFSEGARWRAGTKRAFCSQLEKFKRVQYLAKAKKCCIAIAMELFFNEGQVKKNKTWDG